MRDTRDSALLVGKFATVQLPLADLTDKTGGMIGLITRHSVLLSAVDWGAAFLKRNLKKLYRGEPPWRALSKHAGYLGRESFTKHGQVQ